MGMTKFSKHHRKFPSSLRLYVDCIKGNTFNAPTPLTPTNGSSSQENVRLEFASKSNFKDKLKKKKFTKVKETLKCV